MAVNCMLAPRQQRAFFRCHFKTNRELSHLDALFDFSFGSKTEVGPRNRDFRSSLNSGHSLRDEGPSPAATWHLQFGSLIQENAGFNSDPASNAPNVVDRDIALGPLDAAEIGALDPALVPQRFLA